MLKRSVLVLLLIGTLFEQGSYLLANPRQEAKPKEIKNTTKERLREKIKAEILEEELSKSKALEQALLQENVEQKVENQELKKQLSSADKKRAEDSNSSFGIGVVSGIVLCIVAAITYRKK